MIHTLNHPGRWLLCLMSILIWNTPALAASKLEGPVSARVLHIYDGDTIRVAAEIWPNQEIDVRIRIRGIDGPEIRTRCKAEKRAAHAARNYLARLVRRERLYLTNISGGKYYNRVLADVHLANGTSLAEQLLQRRMVRPYTRNKGKHECGFWK